MIALFPTSLVDHIITPPDAPWKAMDVKFTQLKGSVDRDGIKCTSICITGSPPSASRAKAWLDEKVKSLSNIDTTIEMKVDKQFHGSIIGEKGGNVKRLMNKYSVKITIPPKNSENDIIKIQGQPDSVDAAKKDIRNIVNYEMRSHCTLNISPSAAGLIHEQVGQLAPFLRYVAVNIERGTITMHGHSKGINRAKQAIRAMEEQVSREITIGIILDDFTQGLIKADLKFLEDMKERCLEPDEPVESILSPNLLKLIGSQKNLAMLQKELEDFMSLGCACVLGKRITAYRHVSLLAKDEKLIEQIRQHARVMVYFPCSGGYRYVDMPKNMDALRRDDVPYEDIVKIVGRTIEECEMGRDFLEARVEKQREKEKEKKNTNPTYKFPACLNDVVRTRIDPMFKTLGVTIDSKSLTIPHPMLWFVSDDPGLSLSSGKGWKINKRPAWSEKPSETTIPMCEWVLSARSSLAYTEAEKELRRVIAGAWQFIGVVSLQNIAQLNLLRASTGVSEAGNSADICFDIIEENAAGKMIIGGSSKSGLESFVAKVVSLVANLEE